MSFRSARAVASETPGFRRPMALAQWLPRVPTLLPSISSGTHICVWKG